MNHAGACTSIGAVAGVREIAVMRVEKRVFTTSGMPQSDWNGVVGGRPGYSTMVAFSMITSSIGTSWWKPELAVRTPLMASTTSVPSTTLPNTA